MSFDEIRGLHLVNETRHFTHRFFDDLEEVSEEIDSVDNVVLDLNVVYSVARGRKYVSELFAENESIDEAFDVLGENAFSEKSRNGKNLLEFKSTPYSRMKSVDQINCQIYISDITGDRIRNSRDEMSNPEGVIAYFEDIAEYLSVKDIMGVEEYTREHVESEISEDEALVECASELDGDTVVWSYDEHMLGYDIPATIPEIATSITKKIIRKIKENFFKSPLTLLNSIL